MMSEFHFCNSGILHLQVEMSFQTFPIWLEFKARDFHRCLAP